MLDLCLAIAHHLLIFSIFGLIFAEFVALKNTLDETSIRRLAGLDAAYGVLALLILVIGFVRAIYAAKGWAYYSHNGFFWAKIAAFVATGVVSIGPTRAFIRWKNTAGPPDAQALRQVRALLHAELTLFMLLPIFAALMARGYGQF